MKAVIFHGIGDIRLDDMPEPTIQEPTDAIVRLIANAEEPVEIIQQLTGGIGVDRAIDTVGVDATRPYSGPAAQQAEQQAQQFGQELPQTAPQTNPQGSNWHPGDAPSQALTWAVQALAKAGTLSIIGVYPLTHRFFPIGWQ